MISKQPTIDDIYNFDAYISTPGVREGLMQQAEIGGDEFSVEDTDDGQAMFFNTPHGEQLPVGRPVQLAAGPAQTVTDSDPYAGRGYGEIKAIEPTTRQRIASFLQAGFEGMGVDRARARRHAESLIGGPSSNLPLTMGLADLVPLLGTGLQLEEGVEMGKDAKKAAERGNYGEAALLGTGAALSVLPGAVPTVKALTKTGKAVAPKVGEMLGDYMQRSGLQPNLVAFHGTPHKFDKFDSSKIGPGEGNQAFGYGLYFAENPKVANDYRFVEREWFDTSKATYKGKTIDQHYEQAQQDQQRAIRSKNQALEKEANARLSFWEDVMVHNHPELVIKNAVEDMEGWPELTEYAKSIDPKSFKGISKPGNLMTVDIPDGMVANMLDWDAPLSQQPKAVQDFFVDVQRKPGENQPLGEWLKPMITEGSNITDDMRQAGIPGIRYFDQGSRDSGKGTRNLVVFPGGEADIKILKTEGAK